MKKKIALLTLALVLLFTFSACGGGEEKATESKESAKTEESAEPVSLVGEWKSTDNKSEDTYQTATITDNSIAVYWIMDGGETKSLYWAGSFTAPKDGEKEFTIESKNDKEQTGSALLASSDDIKTFTYKNNQISYEVSAMGTTKTVKLEKIG